MHRRTFLRMTGAALAASAFPPVIRKALAIPAPRRHRSIMDVEHVVILMQENRAFDHYFGTLAGRARLRRPLHDPAAGRPLGVGAAATRDGTTVLPYRLDSTHRQRAAGVRHAALLARRAGAPGTRARPASGRAFKQPWSMGYYARGRAAVPVRARQRLHGLRRLLTARSTRAPIRTACSCSPARTTRPAPAAARRSPTRTTRSARPTTATPGRPTPSGCEAAGICWKVYQDLADNFSDNSLAGFRQYREPFFERHPVAAGAEGPLDDAHAARTLDGLRDDVLAGALPQVSWIVAPAGLLRASRAVEPRAGRLVHAAGAGGADRRPRRVERRPCCSSMFDENDGYFDHVPPPCAPSLNPDGSLAGASTVDGRRPSATRRRQRLRPGPARADDRGLAVEPRRLGRLARPSTTRRSSASSRSASA